MLLGLENRSHKPSRDLQNKSIIGVSVLEIQTHGQKTLRACSLRGRGKAYGGLIVVEGARKKFGETSDERRA